MDKRLDGRGKNAVRGGDTGKVCKITKNADWENPQEVTLSIEKGWKKWLLLKNWNEEMKLTF